MVAIGEGERPLGSLPTGRPEVTGPGEARHLGPCLKRYACLCAGLVVGMLFLFMVIEALGVPQLTQPAEVRSGQGALAGAAGLMLLVVDVVLPVPSSLVMIGNGALFGVPVGIVLSMVGSLGAFAVGFAVGRRSLLVARVVGEEDRRTADRVLCRWGLVAIILSRPIPMVAETMSLVAGTSSLRWRSALSSAALGSLPAAAVYAVAGSVAANFATGATIFIVVAALSLSAALIVARRSPAVRMDPGAPTPPLPAVDAT